MASHSAVHLQLHSPTGVTHSSRAFLTHPPSAASDGQEGPLPNLIVVRSTVLEVYCALRLPGSEVRLELACRQKLYGVVESLAVLRGRTGRAGHDAVLLTFRDAKLSVLQWDPASHDLVPSSLHYFEGDESLRAGRQAFARPPLVVSDPRGRCAAVLMFRHQLAVLPATEAEAEAAALGVVTEGEALTAAAVGNSYIDNLGKAGIRDVRDAVFLHGTSEPTLLVLHEGDPTWAGTLRTKKDTCSLSALSINMTAKRHPRIWGAQGLPSDAYRAIATPTGGVLVLTNSMVLYYAQGVQAGVVLHSAALPTKAPLPPLAFDLTREAPGAAAARYAKAHANDLHPQAASDVLAFCDTSCAHWNLDCDAACAAWLSSTTALLGLKSGQLLLVELKRQGGAWKVVVGRAGAAPQPACMATLSSSIVFIGSVTGDSLLVQCTLGTQQQAGTSATGQNGADHGEEGREAKRRRLESADADAAQVGPRAPASGEESDEEALLIYGDDDSGATGARPEGSPPGLTCSLRVLDSFISIGPVRAIVSSGSVSGGALKASPYLLACCGAGKGGALAVLSRSVAPDVLTEVPLPGVMGAWAVGQAPNGSGNAFLLLTFPSSTKVLEAADQLREVTDEFEFAGDVPTLAAGAMCGGSQLLQAFPQGLRLLQDGQQVQEVWAAELAGPGAADSAAIAAVAIEDPYLLVHLADGSARVLRADASTGKIEVLGALPLDPGVRITAAALYKDSCGWLGRQLATSDVDSTADTLFAACAAFSDGTLALWCLPDLSGPPIWRAASLTEGHPILTPVASNAPLPMEASQAAAVVEVRLESFGSAWQSRPELPSPSAAPGCGPPVLCILTSDHTLLAYKAFSAAGRDPCGGATCLRFKRIHIDCPALLPPAANPSEGAPRIPRMVRFDGLGEQIPHNGLMVAGEVPLWLIACRGSLVAHPGAVGPGLAVSGFTPFNNINCPHGFITTCSGARGCIQICGLPTRQRLEAPWPRQKISIKATPVHVTLYPEAQLYALVAARQAPYRAFLPEEEGGEPQASFSYALADARAKAQGSVSQHEIRLVQPGSWATLWRYALLPGEEALTVEAVHLKDARTGSTVPLLAVGTGFAAGEDYPCSGRVLLFEVRRQREATGAEWGAEVVYAREFKGPVTQVATLEGHLLLATGNRLETCTLSSTPVVREVAADGDAGRVDDGAVTYSAQRSAFYEGPMLVTSLTVVKSFVLIGDVQHSVQFVRYKEEGRQLTLLSKDFGKASVRAAQFFIAGSSLHIVAADASGTLRAYTYTPNDPTSWKGQKLSLWGALHVGDGIGSITRLRMAQADASDTTVRQAALYGTDVGGLGVVAPLAIGHHVAQLSELKALQKELEVGAPHAAGLNPAAFRRRYARIPVGLEGAKQYGAPLAFAKQGLVDGELLMAFVHLPRAVQHRLAARAGLDRERVLSALSTIAKTSQLL